MLVRKSAQGGRVVRVVVRYQNGVYIVNANAYFVKRKTQMLCVLAGIYKYFCAARLDIGGVSARARVKTAYFIVLHNQAFK
jgi:hypothetical protein